MDRFPKLETGYDTAAVESYTIFRQDKATGKIPVNVKFQVGILTPASFFGPNSQPAFQAQVETHYEAALLKAIQNIQTNVPHDDLAIQFDVAMEFGLVHGAWYEEWIGPVACLSLENKEALKDLLVEQVVKLVLTVKEEVGGAGLPYVLW